MTSIERTAYPQFKKLTSVRVLHVFFTPTLEEVAWARERTNEPAALFALVLDLKCFQMMARFCTSEEIPEVVVDPVRRCLELEAEVEPHHGAPRTAAHTFTDPHPTNDHQGQVRGGTHQRSTICRTLFA